jgi:hypothetical protein
LPALIYEWRFLEICYGVSFIKVSGKRTTSVVILHGFLELVAGQIEDGGSLARENGV